MSLQDPLNCFGHHHSLFAQHLHRSLRSVSITFVTVSSVLSSAGACIIVHTQPFQ